MPPLPSSWLLTPDELREAGIRLFGDRPGWQSRLAEATGVDRSSITRWLGGSIPVPLHISLLVRYMLRYGPPGQALDSGQPRPPAG
ncbi:helix-turn-helix domain-containing protein [Cereibacter sphaeroides]|uniref:helix-turn-helix domain-containing protein n=1 Tax=Cereibacter sphaeroides TaxID=1063 RepID=UPI001F248C1E|nr:helix-turn-helix domain-containing protein [Cereibacter sphaeroides]MCE6959282.1 helix-turn-helix domain-containing protein [Cereibacter sphaeroides]MCE6972874.1 helix-turn-helix domain-containing protein [Cereibacter sphaeroides]